MASYSVTINGSAISAMIQKATQLEEILYNDLTGQTSGYTPDKLAKYVQMLRSNYVIANNITITTSDLLNKNYTQAQIEKMLKGTHTDGGPVLIMSLHHTTDSGGALPLGVDTLLEKLGDDYLKQVRVGAANEIIENILVNALGQALDHSGHKINSTASYLTSHADERLADIELTYTQGIGTGVRLDAKSSLDNFHIAEIGKLQDRKEIANTKQNMILPMGLDQYEQFAHEIFSNELSIADVEITENVVGSDAWGHIVDLCATYHLSAKSLSYLSEQLLKNKYEQLNYPLLFVSPNNLEVKTLSQVLTDLVFGKGSLDVNNLTTGSIVNKKFDGEYHEAIRELQKEGEDVVRQKLNKISLWYGKPTSTLD